MVQKVKIRAKKKAVGMVDKKRPKKSENKKPKLMF